MSFWINLKNNNKPFFCLAPMADVTDVAFRQLISKYGKPDVMWTEFVSANGLASQGRDALLIDLKYEEIERPIVAQIFSSNINNIETVSKLICDLGFDGIDINMGCPDKTIEKQGAGAAMIKTPEIAVDIIRAVKRGIKTSGKNIPLSVKTRVGYNDVEINKWISVLLAEGIDALTVHARTRKDMSKVPANWDYIKEVVKLRDNLSPNTVIIGNGDVISIQDGINKAEISGCDGVMVGRALFGNPWFFDKERSVIASLPKKYPKWIRNIPFFKKYFDTKRQAANSNLRPITVSERLNIMVEHTKLFESLLGKYKNFSIMKKHFKAYATGFDNAKELRINLMETKNSSEVEVLVNNFLTKE